MTQEPNVNVIFHGLYVFVQRKDGVHILLPKIADHVYLAGPFLAEQTLAPRHIASPYFLDGIKGTGEAKLDPAKNVVFEKQDYDTTAGPDVLHARILLPKPVEIHSLRPMKDAYTSNYNTLGEAKGGRLSLVQVFRYCAPEIDQVRFKPHADIPPHEVTFESAATPGVKVTKAFVNLHIFSEQDRDIINDAHALNDFDQAIQLLPGLRTRLHATSTSKFDHEPPDAARKAEFLSMGFVHAETFDLVERQALLLNAGVAWRQGGQYPPDTVELATGGSGSTACGGLGSDGD